jgi:hypothetical protein
LIRLLQGSQFASSRYDGGKDPQDYQQNNKTTNESDNRYNVDVAISLSVAGTIGHVTKWKLGGKKLKENANKKKISRETRSSNIKFRRRRCCVVEENSLRRYSLDGSMIRFRAQFS